MTDKEEELRPGLSPPTLTPAFSCRRWSRLTGKSVSPSDAKAWRKLSHQRASTAPCHSGAGLEPRLLPVSPRPAARSLLSSLTPSAPDQLSAQVGRVYGSRASPIQQRKQQLDAVKDAIYLPAVTSRGPPPLPRDRQIAVRPARSMEWARETNGWLGSSGFEPPPGIRLLSTDLPELRARLMRYSATTSSQYGSVALFSPTPPPPIASPTTTRQTAPGSQLSAPQSGRPASRQHPRHHRKLKSQGREVEVGEEAGRQVAGAAFAAVSSTGSLEAEIVDELESRDARESARGIGHDRRGMKEAGGRSEPASDECTSTTSTDVVAALEPSDERPSEVEAVIAAIEQFMPSAERPRAAGGSNSLDGLAVEAAEDVQASHEQRDAAPAAGCAAEALPECVEVQTPSERDVNCPNGKEQVDSRGGERSEHHNGGELATLDTSAACHEGDVAIGLQDAEMAATELPSPEQMPSMPPPTAVREAGGGISDCSPVGDDEDGGDPRREATETATSPVQITSTVPDASTNIQPRETQSDNDNDREAVDEQGESDREPTGPRSDSNTADLVVNSTADNSVAKHQLDVPIIEPTIDVDTGTSIFGMTAHESEGDADYSDEGDAQDGDGDATTCQAAEDSDPSPVISPQSVAEPVAGAAAAQQATASASSSRRPSVSTYDADFEDDGDVEDVGDDRADLELQYYDSD